MREPQILISPELRVKIINSLGLNVIDVVLDGLEQLARSCANEHKYEKMYSEEALTDLVVDCKRVIGTLLGQLAVEIYGHELGREQTDYLYYICTEVTAGNDGRSLTVILCQSFNNERDLLGTLLISA